MGKINIIIKDSLLSSHVVIPREGHLEAVIHFMAHVGQRYNFRLVNYPSYPETDYTVFKKCDWSECFRDVKEAVCMNVPEP